jgi:hypothetical protein
MNKRAEQKQKAMAMRQLPMHFKETLKVILNSVEPRTNQHFTIWLLHVNLCGRQATDCLVDTDMTRG